MTDYEKTKKCVEWFREHRAKRTVFGKGEVEIVDWARPDTSSYSLRYLFDVTKGTCTITGDVGACVVKTFWKDLCPETFASAFRPGNIRYFDEKVSCCESRYVYDRDEFEKDLEKDVGGTEYADLRDCIREKFTEREGVPYDAESWLDFDKLEELNDLDPDYWEWLYDLGKRFSIRMFAYVVGMQMAVRQLKGESR